MTPRWRGCAVGRSRNFPDARRDLESLSAQVGADLLPVASARAGLPEGIGGEIKRGRISRRKNHRFGPDDAEFIGTKWLRQDVLRLVRAAIEAREPAAVNDVGILRRGRDVAVFLRADRLPVAKSDRAVRPAAGDSDRAAFLLPAVEAIGEGVIRADVIKLRGGLVIPRAPGLATVDRDDRALVAGEENNLRVVGIDPDVLVIVAAGRAAPAFPGLATVGRLPANHTRRINDVRIFRIDPHHRQIAAADPRARAFIGRGQGPVFAGVIRAIKFPGVEGGDGGKERARVARCNRELGLDDVVRQTLRQLLPGPPAVGRFENAAVGPVPIPVFPWTLARFPERGVSDLRIARIELHIGRAGVFILVERLG